MGKDLPFYAVHSGITPGIYSTWEECKEQVIGFSKPKFKKFKAKDAAEYFFKYGQELKKVANEAPVKEKPKLKNCNLRFDKPKKNQETEKTGVVFLNSLSSTLKRSYSELKAHNTKLPKDSVEIIYTDGSSIGNGKAGARAGVGVFFGKDDVRNVSERLSGEIQTNQRAEVTAAIRALEKATSEKKIEIRTDSRYLIKGITEWVPIWMSKDWKTMRGGDVKNRDLFETLHNYIRYHKLKVTWKHVSAHTGVPGNENADRLAVAGAHLNLSPDKSFSQDKKITPKKPRNS